MEYSVTFVARNFNGTFIISKESYLLVLMNISSGTHHGFAYLYSVIPKCNGGKHAKKKASGSQRSNSLVLSNKEQNKEQNL